MLAIRIGDENQKIFSSEVRATMVSVESMVYSVVMVVFSPVIGWLAEYFSISWAFGLLGMFVGIVAVSYTHLLKIISVETTYGYEIVMKLQDFGFEDMKEGTIYPLLVRLEKKKMISSEFRPSPLGPSRKYYFLTEAGGEQLREFEICWRSVSDTVESILMM